MPYFLCRMIPPRPHFVHSMNAAEAQAMRAHVAYWVGLAGAGTAIVYGPVHDPAGGWGIGIVEVADEAAVQQLAANDPAVLAGIGLRYEVMPMSRPVLGGQAK